MKLHGWIFIVAALTPALVFANASDRRGLLPEIRLEAGQEVQNENRQLTTEILVTKAETAAIASLQKLIQKKKNTAAEADLQHRLAELYMRRARTGRFLDLHQNSKNLRLSSFPEPPGRGGEWIRKAITVYGDIEKRFPSYAEMDIILFQNAFAYQQIGYVPDAEKTYRRLLDKYPKSDLIPDAAVALGELAYDQKRFGTALEYFARAESNPESRVYTYALYKAAWAEYNLKNTDGAVKKLLVVLKACPPDSDESLLAKRRQNLRRESLRDLGLFSSETLEAGEMYAFFKPITTEEELGQTMADLSKMYFSHSRHKELAPLLEKFLKNHEDNPHRLRARLNLMQAEESSKNRPQVLAQLRKAADDCRPTSSWRVRQTAEKVQESCVDGFRNQSREIASKWWDTWKKNQQNKEFAGYTEEALRLVLETEDPMKPDGVTRLAFGELLFQMGRFPEASEHYEKAGQDKTLDAEKSHDAVYGALFALEKIRTETKQTPDPIRRKALATAYVERFPKGEHTGDVILSLAVIEAENKDLVASRKWLKPLLEASYGRSLQIKAEDVALDLLNQEKNYRQLAVDAKAFAARDNGKERALSLRKIEAESSFAQLRLDSEKMKDADKAKTLSTFAEKHQDETLGYEALMEALGLNFKIGFTQRAAESVDKILKTKPTEPRLKDILPDLAARLAAEGELKKAAIYLREAATRDPKNTIAHQEAAADFLLLEGEGSQARTVYRGLLPNADKEMRIRLYTKIQNSLRGNASDKERQQLEDLVLSQNLEPFATKLLTDRANEMLKRGQTAAAFEAARKIMSRERPAAERADARLIQARILEEEFIRQSVKSSKEDRFSMVLAMKTEKLEKAQTAYLSMLKMSEEPRLQVEGLSGVERCLGHYIESLERIQPPASFSEADVAALRQEISNLLAPIKAQRDEHRQQWRQIASLARPAGAGTRWEDLAGQDSPTPQSTGDWKFLKPYLVREWSTESKNLRRYTERKPVCDQKRKTPAACLAAGKWELAESEARLLLEDPARRSEGIYHLALAAEGRGQTDKALWMLRSLARSEASPAVLYEVARMTAARDGVSAASKDFSELLKSSMDSTEIKTLRFLRAYSEGDYGTVIELSSAFSNEDIYTLELGLLLSESFAQRGEVEKALRVLAELGKKDRRAEIDIQAGRLNEVYKIAPLPALEKYAQALSKAKDPAQQEWLKRKIEFMKVNFKVGLNVSSAGL